MQDDLTLFDQWRQGDRNAGNTLLKRHFQSLYHFFGNKVQDDVDELIQTTFLACIGGKEQFRKQSSFRSYLFGIARNQLYTYYRRKSKKDKLDFGVTSVAAMSISPTSRLARNRRHHLLLQALRSLPVDQQILLELHYWEGMGTVELSEIFDIAETATRARLSRARKTLRKRLDKQSAGRDVQYRQLDDLDSWARSVRDEEPLGR